MAPWWALVCANQNRLSQTGKVCPRASALCLTPYPIFWINPARAAHSLENPSYTHDFCLEGISEGAGCSMGLLVAFKDSDVPDQSVSITGHQCFSELSG